MTTRTNPRFRHEFILSISGVYPSLKLRQEKQRRGSCLRYYSPVAEIYVSNVKDGAGEVTDYVLLVHRMQ